MYFSLSQQWTGGLKLAFLRLSRGGFRPSPFLWKVKKMSDVGHSEYYRTWNIDAYAEGGMFFGFASKGDDNISISGENLNGVIRSIKAVIDRKEGPIKKKNKFRDILTKQIENRGIN